MDPTGVAATTASWNALPNEMMLEIIDFLGEDDVGVLSKVDQRTYRACIPARFRKVRLTNYEVLEMFLENVPRRHLAYIEDLFLSTKCSTAQSLRVLPRIQADAFVSLLSATVLLRKFVLEVEGSLDKSVLLAFSNLTNLRNLSIANCGDEFSMPLSERFVVSMAASTRHLEDLTLDRITRSKVHAPELEGVYPCPPLTLNDTDIPDHPIFGWDLSLPSLLRIPTLRKLTIRDTHLGHEGWASVPMACQLSVLDLGACCHEAEEFNTRCAERIMAAVGRTVDEFSLTTAVCDRVFAKPSSTPLQKLRKVHISVFFPIDSVVETISNLAGSPVERISVQSLEEDVVDVCAALEDFLSVRVGRGPEFFNKLERIDVAIISSDDDGDGGEGEEEWRTAVQRLQEYCSDVQLASAVDKIAAEIGSGKTGSDNFSFTNAKRYPAKGRSMTI